MALRGVVQGVSELNAEQATTMYQLLCKSFQNVLPEVFYADLAEKDQVILLYDSCTGNLKGFSTQMVFDHWVDGMPYRIVFSGDTIIDPASWGSMELPLVWGTWMLSLWEDDPEVPLLWMLISQGMRTYRFLPVFFKRFFPCYDQPTPRVLQRIMHSLGERRYPKQYDPKKGVIIADPRSCYLRQQLAEIPGEYLRDPHVQFFSKMNPGYVKGDELLCLTQFEPGNLEPFILNRLVRRRKAQSRVIEEEVHEA